MRVTIVRDDNIVIVDGVTMPVDCSALPPWVHAIQRNGDLFDIECKGASPIKGVTDFSPYQYLIDDWKVEKNRQEEIAAKAKADAAEREKRLSAEAQAARRRTKK